MKKVVISIIIVLLLIIACSDNSDTIKKYMNAYEKPIKTGLLTSDGHELFLVLSKEQKNKHEQALIYENDKVFLYIDKAKAIDQNSNVLFDVSEAPGQFYGWDVTIGINKETKKSSGIICQWWADRGEKTTDPIILNWDTNKNAFKVFRIDPIEY